MDYVYTPSNTSASSRLSSQAVIMQIINSISTIVNLFISSFLVSFIMSINANEPLSGTLISVGLYNISLYVVFTLVYFGISYIVDKTRRIWIFRISLIVKGLFIILIIFLGKKIAKFAILAGAVQGIADALYWASYNVIKGEIVSRAHFEKYATFGSILGKVVSIIFPVLIGYLIDISTFLNIAIYVFLIVIIQVVLTIFIKSMKPKGAHFDFFDYRRKLKSNSPEIKRVKRFYPLALVYGFKTVIGSIVPILTIYTFKTNLNLGIFTALTSIFSIFVLILFNKFTKYGHRKIIFAILGAIMLISSVIVAIWLEKWSYVVYNFAQSFAYIILANTIDADRNVIIKKTGFYDEIAEHNFLTETLLNISRIIGYALMVVFGLFFDILGLKILTIIMGFGVPVLAYFQNKLEEYEKDYPINLVGQRESDNKPAENNLESQ